MAVTPGLAVASNRAEAWGDGLWGRLGNGVTRQVEHKRGDVHSPSPICAVGTVGTCTFGSALTEVRAISAGGSHGLALMNDGTVTAWGENAHGQLGDGTNTGPESCASVSGFHEEFETQRPCSAVPVIVSGLSGVSAVAAGANHSLALLSDGTVWAWGENSSGQLGDGSTTESDIPVAVSGLSGVVAIAAGGSESLALLSDGTVEAWGDNSSGQLGDGTTTNREAPVPVSGLSGVTAIAAGGAHSLAVLSDGTAMAWGANGDGRLGDGSTEDSHVPVAVSSLSGVTAISAGEGSLALVEGGDGLTWGTNFLGLLGIGGQNGGPASSDVPVQVCAVGTINQERLCSSVGGPYLTGASAISAGPDHDVALLSTGAVVSWGQGCVGQMGNGTGVEGGLACTTFDYVPKEASELSAVQGVAAGEYFSAVFGPPAPVVASVSPSSGPATGGASVTINGSNFTEVTGVKFGTTKAGFTVNSSGKITTTSPTGSGTVDVTVTSTSGASSITAADHYTFVPAPNVTGVKPSEGTQAGATSVAITGTNLGGATGVRFGGISAKGFTVNSSSKITAKSPAGSGIVDITVTTAGGTSATGGADQFHYLPGISKVSPTIGPTAGGTTVTITGVGFTGATAVSFGAVPAVSFTVNSGTSVTAVSPAQLAGIVDIRITTPEGSTALTNDKFKYSPTVSSVSPGKGPLAGGTLVTVTGTGFSTVAKATVIKFGTTNGNAVSCASTTECSATAPAHAAGKVDVIVTVNKVASPKSASDGFTYE
ncbi:MAG TPA: IPT/TIG domain-containing protein [Solirubrobacteraceae bacterium]